MKYIALIFENEQKAAAAPPAEQEALFGRYMAFTEEVKQSGHLRGGEPLQPTSTATTVRAAGGKVSTLDGPYAETKEQLAGFYLFECKDLDEAIELGARICRLHEKGEVAVEVRPVLEIPQ
ncbi:MAG: YciI family protein [Acidobacteria bacterium]|nr:YciI family protein [Acidobacteriota bacterium]